VVYLVVSLEDGNRCPSRQKKLLGALQRDIRSYSLRKLRQHRGMIVVQHSLAVSAQLPVTPAQLPVSSTICSAYNSVSSESTYTGNGNSLLSIAAKENPPIDLWRRGCSHASPRAPRATSGTKTKARPR
jgi:hypothetical protein